MPTIEDVVRTEQDNLALETRIAKCPPYTAINDLDEVCRTPSSLRFQHPTTVKPLANARGGAFIVECPSLHAKTLWVATANDSYREDYLRYVNAAYGLALDALPKAYDVDHLYNRARAQAYSLRYIRVALVTYRANRSHGAAYEKQITTNEAGRTTNDRKLMDEISSMKYFGFLCPLQSNPRPQEIQAYAAFASAKLGLDPGETVRSVSLLHNKALTPWARKP